MARRLERSRPTAGPRVQRHFYFSGCLIEPASKSGHPPPDSLLVIHITITGQIGKAFSLFHRLYRLLRTLRSCQYGSNYLRRQIVQRDILEGLRDLFEITEVKNRSLTSEVVPFVKLKGLPYKSQCLLDEDQYGLNPFRLMRLFSSPILPNLVSRNPNSCTNRQNRPDTLDPRSPSLTIDIPETRPASDCDSSRDSNQANSQRLRPIRFTAHRLPLTRIDRRQIVLLWRAGVSSSCRQKTLREQIHQPDLLDLIP